METIAPSTTLAIDPEAPPLRLDAGNVVRVGSSRVSIDLVVEQYENRHDAGGHGSRVRHACSSAL